MSYYKNWEALVDDINACIPDAGLNFSIKSYLEGLYYLPLETVLKEWRGLITIDSEDTKNKRELTEEEAFRKEELLEEYSWLKEEEPFVIPPPPAETVDVEAFRKREFARLRTPYYKRMDAQLNEAMKDKLLYEKTEKLDAYKAWEEQLKLRFPKE